MLLLNLLLFQWLRGLFNRMLLAETIEIPLLNTFITEIISPIILLLVAVSLLVFLFGVLEMIAKSGSEEGRTTGRKHVIWGLIGLFIIISAFGIINLIKATIGV